MAVGLARPEELLPVSGVRLAAVAAGIKKNATPDMVVLAFDSEVNCAVTFTRNAFCAAPVTLAKAHLSQSSPRALLINSGNANAGTGETGMANAVQSCQWLAQQLACSTEQVLPFSTGVIGEQLPMAAMESGIAEVGAMLSADNWLAAAEGIMTTDTIAKAISKTISIDGEMITITGIAKGSGMIRPDMATMLSFIATDARIETPLLQRCLVEAVDNSFNSITVDGDTSTNDACVLVATGKADADAITESSTGLKIFTEALSELCQYLAQAIIRDAEGATKFVTVEVESASSVQEARDVAYTIAHSPLVKTALFASDPNWGRILAAVGRAGIERLDISAVDIYLGDVCIVNGGGVDAAYTEEQGQQVMHRDEITIRVALGRGEHHAVIWTSDLSHEYVRINSEYRS